jgi:NAD(P)-dependent dehydrogenase (short-subunit alcohol dehydrogenase family)
MRIVVVGATGTIGSKVADALARKHEVLRASRKGNVKVDIDKPASIQEMFARIGKVDAVVSAAGNASFGKLTDLGDDDFELSLGSKLMGQVNVIRHGLSHLAPDGSITVTTGVLSARPMPGSAAISLVNGGLEAFVRAAALELVDGKRVNAVSPGWVSETLEKMGMAPSTGTPAARVAEVYVRAVEGKQNGEILEAFDLG